MDRCYLCGEEFNQSSVVKHGEHIIQQAIGGGLIVNSILCRDCGILLGKEIDKPFNDIFESIAVRLDIRKDRESRTKTKSIKGTIISETDVYGVYVKGIEVVWNNFEITPVTPFHRYIENGRKLIIYASKKQLTKYIKKVEKEIENNKLEIVKCHDITALVEFPFPMNNKHFKRGIAKIAIGFACSQGILRDKLPLVLDLNVNLADRIKENIPLVQYYPLGIIDSIIEREKSKIRNYPSHCLILFTTLAKPTKLVCYIELFSTFQWYVVLNDDYQGEEIYKYHFQSLQKLDDYHFEPDRRYYKERMIYLDQLGITEDRIETAFRNQKDGKEKKSKEEIEIRIVKEECIKQKYKVDFKNEVKVSVDFVLQQYSVTNNNLNENINFYENVKLFYPTMDYIDFNIISYRRFYKRGKKYRDYVDDSLVLLIEDPDKMREHSYFRFNELSFFMQKQLIDKKF